MSDIERQYEEWDHDQLLDELERLRAALQKIEVFAECLEHASSMPSAKYFLTAAREGLGIETNQSA